MDNKRRLLPLGLPLLALVVAAPAYAAVSYSYNTAGLSLSVTGDAANDDITLTCVAGEVSPASSPAAPCETLESLRVRPGAGSDDVDLRGLTAADFPALASITVDDEDDFVADAFFGSDLDEVFTVEYEDDVAAGGGDDIIEGGNVVDGGPGDDVLIEVSGEGGADGGPGDDRFVQTLAIGGNDGGPGYDVMEVDYDRLGTKLDDVSFTLTAAQLALAIPGDAQDTFVVNFEEFRFTMVRGDGQTFDAAEFPGKVYYRGSRGSETFTGSDQQDVVATGKGDDSLFMRDGVLDLVNCGEGDDTAVVDAVDVVTNCETVDYPVPATSRINGPKKIKKGSSASYTFGSSIDGSVFGCRIDKGSWTPCASPYTVKAKGKLKKGKHTLLVRAGYPAGNWDATPSRRKIKIKR